MQHILVTGAKGQVGSELQYLSGQYPQFIFHFTDLPELDLTEPESIRSFFAMHPIDYCINCAAFTAVDKAESEAELAHKINVEAVETLAACCAKYGAGLVQLSSDYVYHNGINRALLPTDPTQPQSVYARTKLEGDEQALALNPRTLVIRTSWVYSGFGHNFVKTMLRLGQERDSLGVIYDQVGTPTYARDLAAALLHILSLFAAGTRSADTFRGIYHYSNEGVTSWYDFAKAIFDLENIVCEVSPINTSAYPTPAKRPPFSLLDKAAIKADFDLTIPYWRDSLKQCLNILRQES